MSKGKNYMPSHAVPDAYVDIKKYIEFDSEELPEILGWMVGGKYRLELLVEEVSESKDSEQDSVNVRFKILDVSARGDNRPTHLKNLIDPPKMKHEIV